MRTEQEITQKLQQLDRQSNSLYGGLDRYQIFNELGECRGQKPLQDSCKTWVAKLRPIYCAMLAIANKINYYAMKKTVT